MSRIANTATAQTLLEVALDVILDGIDVGGNGALVLTDTDGGGGTDLIDYDLGATAFAAAGFVTDEAIAAKSAALAESPGANGTVAGYRIEDGNDANIITGDAGAGTEDIVLDNAAVTTSQTVTISTLTIALPDGT